MDADEFLGKLQKLAELLKQGKISEIDINLLIAATPTVDAVEVARGEWIYENEWMCSVCKEPALYEVQVYGGGNYKDCDVVWSNYCPHCGAKMEK